MSGLIDILVICPLDVEYRALKKQFQKKAFIVREEVQTPIGCQHMFQVRVTSADCPTSHINVCVVQAIHQGVLRAACLTSVLLAETKPRVVVSFGIAGLFEPSDFELGDVCYPETIYYYEPAKDSESKVYEGVAPSEEPVPSSPARSTSSALEKKSVRESAAIPFSCDSVSFPRPPVRFRFKLVLDRPIASGEKLIADSKSSAKGEALRIMRKMVGVEMEAAGVACACRSSPMQRPKFIAIKGFSDLATRQSKNPEQSAMTPEEKQAAITTQKKQQRMAARNAANFLVELLRANCRHIERTVPYANTLSKPMLEQYIVSFKNILNPSSVRELLPTDRKVRRAFLSTNVPAVYHLVVSHDGLVGWVDFYFLLILRILRDKFGFVPHVLISESSEPPLSPSKRREVEGLLDRIFNHGSCYVWWSSTIDAVNNLHRHYAEEYRGIDHTFFIDLTNHNAATHGPGWPQHKTDRWLVFLIWISHVMPTQLILAFHRRRTLYDKLREVPGLEPIIIYGKTFALGEDESLESRFHERISSLGILPQSIAPLVDWFEMEISRDAKEGCKLVTRFLQYFEPLYGDSGVCVHNTQRFKALMQQLARVSAGCDSAPPLLERFTALACCWEEEYILAEAG